MTKMKMHPPSDFFKFLFKNSIKSRKKVLFLRKKSSLNQKPGCDSAGGRPAGRSERHSPFPPTHPLTHSYSPLLLAFPPSDSHSPTFLSHSHPFTLTLSMKKWRTGAPPFTLSMQKFLIEISNRDF